METVAIIGTGIAGMAAAARLHGRCRLTLFEKNDYVGGHTNTVDVDRDDGLKLGVDTGFMVYNEVTYPRLTRLFEELGVPTIETDMSFGVHHGPTGFQWSSRAAIDWPQHLSTLLRPRFLRMLREVVRFNRLATASLQSGLLEEYSLGQFLRTHRFSRLFIDAYIVPMTAAIWSTPHCTMVEFPAATLFRFMHNHGLLGIKSQHPWRTVLGGSRHYRKKLIAPFAEAIHTARPARHLERGPDGVQVVDAAGRRETFDRVVVATHADEALALLTQPTRDEQRLLGAFRYSPNEVVLHRDTRVLPASRSRWASWNYRYEVDSTGQAFASTHYWMNRLQRLPGPTDHLVSVNPKPGQIAPETVDWSTTYHHPTFDEAAIAAQLDLPKLNSGRIFFGGSYFRYGFHEDALAAGQDAADALLASIESRDSGLLAVGVRRDPSPSGAEVLRCQDVDVHVSPRSRGA